MRYAARVEYEGTAFHGWQRQANVCSVQGAVESALSRVADTDIAVVCAGRTDTGVHGAGQVVHFDCATSRPHKAWLMGTNTFLPRSVAIKMIQPVADTFHARYSAVARTYRYTICNTATRSPRCANLALWVPQPLDIAALRLAAGHLLGEHDFSAFRAAGCQAKNPVRTVSRLTVSADRGFIYIDITANAFLYNMVRIVAGTLLRVGKGEYAPDWVREILAGRDRTLGGMTVAAHGLYFIGPDYPQAFALPPLEHWPVL